MKRVLLVLLIFLGLFSGACVPAAPPLMSEEEMQTAIAATLGASLPAATPTPALVLPPTWTPTPSPLPSETPVPAPTLDLVPPTATAMPTLTLMPLSFRLSGKGSQATSLFPLREGVIRVVWNYAGTEEELQKQQYAKEVHQANLKYYDDWHKEWVTYYDGILKEAKARGDEAAAAQARNYLDSLQKQYNAAIEKENARYASELNAYQSRFRLTINRSSVNNPQYLGGTTGPGTGEAIYQTVEAYDYYFLVEAPGSWTIEVYY